MEVEERHRAAVACGIVYVPLTPNKIRLVEKHSCFCWRLDQSFGLLDMLPNEKANVVEQSFSVLALHYILTHLLLLLLGPHSHLFLPLFLYGVNFLCHVVHS